MIESEEERERWICNFKIYLIVRIQGVKTKKKKLSKGSPSNYKKISKLVFRQKIYGERWGVGDSMSSITFNDRDEGMPP